MWRKGNPSPAVRVHVRRRVSAALLAVDDFTGRPITSPDLRAEAAELLDRPVRKADGYLLFLDCPAPVLTLTVWAWEYHPRTVQVELAALPPLNPVVKLRLTPNRRYRIPQQTTCLEGQAAPGTQVRVFCEDDPRPLRLLYDYALGDGRLIRLYDPAASDLEGRQFALLRKGKAAPEFFEVQQVSAGQEEGGVLLRAPLARECRKAGAAVLPVWSVQADGEGAFFLPLRTILGEKCRCRVQWMPPGGGWKERPAQLEPGRVTRLDLTDEL